MKPPLRLLVALGHCLALPGCGSPAADTPGTGGGAAGTTAAPGAGTGGASAGSGPGGTGGVGLVAGSSAGGSAGASTGGQAGTAGSSTAGAGGLGGSGGQPGQELPQGVPADYTLALDLPFSSQADLTSILAANSDAWTFDSADGGALKFSGAGYTAPAPVNESLSSFAIVQTTMLSSFVLEVELAQLNPDQAQPHRDLCIVFNGSDHKHFFYAHIAQTHDERSHNIHLINNAPRQPITVSDNGGIQWGNAGTWHKFRLVRDAVAGDISVFKDGNLDTAILTANSTVFTSGYIGFGTFQDSGKVRNLKVWAKAAEQIAAQGFFTQ